MTTSPRRTVLAWLLGSALFNPFAAWGCSCAPAPENTPEEIQRRYAAAKAVFIAKLVSAVQVAPPWNGERRRLADQELYQTIVEDAIFIVTEVFKGSHQVGEIVYVQTDLSPGSCGRSARNEPVWLEELLESADGAVDVRPFEISSDWLIYGEGTQRYEFESCAGGGSSPMNVRGGQDAEYLRSRPDCVRNAEPEAELWQYPCVSPRS